MSRIGRLPVVVPPHVEVHIDGTNIKVKGPKGALEYTFSPDISFALKMVLSMLNAHQMIALTVHCMAQHVP